jgi:heme-degrading monooxygenase HmoA
MHARVTTVAITTAKIAEATTIYDANIGPSIAANKGFRGALLLTDETTGEGVSITLWDTEADGVAYEGSGSYKAQVDKLRSLFTATPSLKTYSVGVEVKSTAGVLG